MLQNRRSSLARNCPLHAGETILIVGHNGINRALMVRRWQFHRVATTPYSRSNCGISVLNAGGLGQPVQLESMNQTAHLGEILPRCDPIIGAAPIAGTSR